MKKFTFVFSLLLMLVTTAMAQGTYTVITGLNSVPSEKIAPSQVTTGYYLLKQVNDNNDCAGGQGVGWIKAANENAGGQSATSKGTGDNPTDVTFIWYVEVVDAENKLITISTANKKAAWQLPANSKYEKGLIAYANRTTLQYHDVAAVDLGQGANTPKDGSAFISNYPVTSYIHFSGNNLGSWTSSGANSTYMVEFYPIADSQINKVTYVDITYSHRFNDVVVKEEVFGVEVGASYPAPTLPSGIKAEGVPTGTVSEAQTIELTCSLDGTLPFATINAQEEFNTTKSWYQMTIRGKQFVYDESSKNLAYKTENYTKNALFAFEGNPYSGYKIYNMAAGKDAVMWNATAGNGTVIAATPIANVTENKDWNFVINGGKYLFVKQGQNDAYMHDYGGKVSYWLSSSAASDPGSFVTFDEVSADIEYITNYTEVKAFADVPTQVNQAYGLVKEFTSNAPETDPNEGSSYDNLQDGNTSSYFHTAWSYGAGASTPHYLQAELTESIESFYFTYHRRTQNNNNRPKTIVISASKDGDAFTEIKTINEGLPTDEANNSYASSLVELGDSYKYVRFTVTETNTNNAKEADGNRFFTFSEFYIFENNADVAKIVSNINQFKSSDFASVELGEAMDYLDNVGAVLALSNLKKEIKAILDDNATNHAETPVLGQYTTSAYNALKSEYDNTEATQESLEAALSAFNSAKNLPVFTIDGVIDYAAGKSIYDAPGNDNGKGNTHYFKLTDRLDGTMLWVFDQTATTVGVTDAVAVVNYATGAKICNSNTIRVTETDPAVADDDIFLFYDASSSYPVHAQKDNSLITHWYSYDAASGSAWKFTYIGNTFDINKLTAEKINALRTLRTFCAEQSKILDKVGEGYGNYNGDTAELLAALAVAGGLDTKSVPELVEMTIDEINNITANITTAVNNLKATINLPAENSYLRIMAVDGWNNDARYLGKANSTAKAGRAEFVDDAVTANTVFYFDGTQLLSVGSGEYLVSNSKFLGYNGIQNEGAKVAFGAVSNKLTSAYNISFNDGTRWLYVNTGNFTDAGSGTDNQNGYCFNLEAVTELPVTVTAAGYASFYAPVALEIPENVEVFYATEVAGDYVSLVKIEGGKIPANTGVIIKADANTYNFAITGEEVAAIEGNIFKGTVNKQKITKENGSYYVLGIVDGKVGMYNAVNGADATTFINAGHKAYMYLEGAASSAGYRFDFDGTTGITEVETENANDAVIYDLTGRRVQDMNRAGIYIVNGKKVLVK